MSQYVVHFELLPPPAFGIPVPGYDVVPEGDGPTFHIDAKTHRMFITRLDGTTTVRRQDEQLRAEIQLNGLEFTFADNTCIAIVDASDEDAAVELARKELHYLFQMHAASRDEYSHLIVPAERAVGLANAPGTRYTAAQRFTVYNNEETAQGLTQIAALLDGTRPDRVMGRALNYLGLGDALSGTLPSGASDDLNQLMLPLMFLQYWKSLATIVGDPSRAKDHQSRPQKLGFDRHFFRHQVKPMHEIRSKFDVAHIEDAIERRAGIHEDVIKCRAAACTVINAYFERVLSENQ